MRRTVVVFFALVGTGVAACSSDSQSPTDAGPFDAPASDRADAKDSAADQVQVADTGANDVVALTDAPIGFEVSPRLDGGGIDSRIVDSREISEANAIDSGAGFTGDAAGDRPRDWSSDGNASDTSPDASSSPDTAPSYEWLVPFAAGQSIRSLAQDSEAVYWAGFYGTVRGVYKVAKRGGTPILIAPTESIYVPEAVVVDSQYAYFTAPGPTANVERLFRAPSTPTALDGGGPTLLSTDLGNYPLVLDGGRLYYARYGSVDIGCYDTRTGTTTVITDHTAPSPTDPGCGMQIGYPGIIDLASDGTYLYYVTWQSYGGSIPSGSPLSYTGWFMRVPLAGGTPAILTPGSTSKCGASTIFNTWTNLVPSGGMLYWGANDGNHYYKMPSQGGPAETQVTYQNAGGRTIAVDGGNFYFWCQDALCRVPLAGGEPVALIPRGNWGDVGGDANLRGILVDDTSVYITLASGQAILKVAK